MVTSGHVTKTAVIPFDLFGRKAYGMLHANLMVLYFIELELWPIKILNCGNRNFRPFCSCDLDLDPMTFIYELGPYSLEIYRMYECEVPTSRLSKAVV